MLEKLRAGEALNAKDRETHDQGLISVLKQLHDDLDAAVLEAYGWEDFKGGTGGSPVSSSQNGKAALSPLSASEALEQQILSRLVTLNHERAAEEKRGLIRYLRPDYQCGGDHRSPSSSEASIQQELAGTETPSSKSQIQNQQSSIVNPSSPLDWPESLPEQVAILRKLIAGYDKSVVTPAPETLAACFGRKNKKRTDQITGILATLKALGHIV